MDDMSGSVRPLRKQPSVDATTLGRLLSLGDSSLRSALCLQLQADFRRLRGALGQAEAKGAAHELKGLAGTVGAVRLAEMARDFDARGPDLAEPARQIIVAALRHEIDSVLAELTHCGETTGP